VGNSDTKAVHGLRWKIQHFALQRSVWGKVQKYKRYALLCR